MKFGIALALLATLPIMSACNRGGGSSVAELEDRHGSRRDVTEDWLIGRWAELDDRDCRRPREFERGGDLMEDGERREWRLREGRGDDVTLEIDRDEYRAERYGSTLVLIDDRDRTTELERCEGDGSERPESRDQGSTSSNMAGPSAPAASADPQLATEIEAGVVRLRSQLPLRQGPLTITSVSSSGTALTIVGTLNVDVTPQQWSQMETRMRQGHCSGNEAAMIRRGASVITQLTDSTGEARTFTTSSCPGTM